MMRDHSLVIQLLLKLLSIYKENHPIVLRICFILGNLTYMDERARKCFQQNHITLLLELLEKFDKMDHLKISNQTEIEDILTKVRIFLNY